jgi:hypothetical protein
MPAIKKIARHLRYAREAKATKRRLALAVPPHLIERVGDDSEEGSWGSRANGQSATAAVNLSGDLESEESEEECEFTDGEDEEFEFNENAFQKLFAGANLKHHWQCQ